MNSKNQTYNSKSKNSIYIYLFVLVLFLNSFSSCQFYKVTNSITNYAEIDKLKNNLKYVIVHQGTNTWHLKNIEINEDIKEISGKTEAVSPKHLHYLKARSGSTNIYKNRNGDPTNEIHFYISEYIEAPDSLMIIPMTSLKKVEIYEKDRGTTMGIIFVSSVILVLFIFYLGLYLLISLI